MFVTVVGLLIVTNVVCAVATKDVDNISPLPKLLTVKVSLKFCVPSATVPTWILNACPVPTVSNALIDNLYFLFTTVDIDCVTVASFNCSLPLPVDTYVGVPSTVVQLVMLDVNSPLVINSVGLNLNVSKSASL